MAEDLKNIKNAIDEQISHLLLAMSVTTAAAFALSWSYTCGLFFVIDMRLFAFVSINDLFVSALPWMIPGLLICALVIGFQVSIPFPSPTRKQSIFEIGPYYMFVAIASIACLAIPFNSNWDYLVYPASLMGILLIGHLTHAMVNRWNLQDYRMLVLLIYAIAVGMLMFFSTGIVKGGKLLRNAEADVRIHFASRTQDALLLWVGASAIIVRDDTRKARAISLESIESIEFFGVSRPMAWYGIGERETSTPNIEGR